MKWRALEISPALAPAWLGQRPVFIPIDEAEEARVVEREGERIFGFDLDEAIATLECEGWADEMRSPTQRLPFPYDRLPWPLRGLGALALFAPRRLVRPRHQPAWPIAPALDVLRFLRGDSKHSLWGDATWGFSLTCDVDSPAGWRRALDVAKAAEGSGHRATFFVVGEVLLGDPGIARELIARGHEIASHDTRHDNRLLTLEERALSARLARAKDIIAPFDGVGFRSPSLLRSPELFRLLSEHFEYDSSVCDTDLEVARGVTSVRPYTIAGIAELPITLPMDSSLRFTLHSKARIAELWREKCAWIRALRGLAT